MQRFFYTAKTEMRHLFSDWRSVEKKLKGRYIFLFLDYDGTLTRIVKRPDKAQLSLETKNLLKRLAGSSMCRVAVISGRSIKDIKRSVGIDNIIYAGNHGLQIEGPKIKFEAPLSNRYIKRLKRIRDELDTKLLAFKGVLVEDKGLTISVHFRSVKKSQIQDLRLMFYEVIRPYLIEDEITIRRAKMAFEVRPKTGQDKGKTILWLLGRYLFAVACKEKSIPVYIGDDLTDEDAFNALRTRGLTIFVGKSKPAASAAQYFLKDISEVKQFLRRITVLTQA